MRLILISIGIVFSLLAIANIYWGKFERARDESYQKLMSTKSSEQLNSKTLASIQSAAINESSGLAFSQIHENAVWTHNDSGGEPRVFLISIESGETLCTLTLDGARNQDWEDMATCRFGGEDYIAVGDIGDNRKMRRKYQIYLFKEPKDLAESNHSTKEWTCLNYRYEDGSINSESLAFDPETESFIFLKKVHWMKEGQSHVYQLELNERTQDSPLLTAQKVAVIEGGDFSAMDISRDGQRMAIRAYSQSYFLFKQAEESWVSVLKNPLPYWYMLPDQTQGEALAFFPDGESVVLTSESHQSAIIRVEIPGGN